MHTETPVLETATAIELRVTDAAWLTEKLDALAKRGARLSIPCTPRLVQLGERRSNWIPTSNRTERELCIVADVCKGGVCPVHWKEEVVADYCVLGELPVLPGGWQLVAAVDHEDRIGTIVREAPGQVCPPEFRAEAASKRCDHCHVSRQRKTCYVLRAVDGRVLQVGSTCVADYLRSTDVESTISALLNVQALWASFWEKVRSGEIDLDTCGGRHDECRPLATLLAHVSACTRANKGFYVTRKQADEGVMPTADVAYFTMTARDAKERAAYPDRRTPQDLVEAAAAIEWAKELPNGSAFEENLRTYARAGVFNSRGTSTAAYIMPAYVKATRPVVHEPKKATPALQAAIKDRIEIDVELVRRASYEVQFGMYPQTMYISIMRKLPSGSVTGDALAPADDDGAIIVWKSREVPMVREGSRLEVGSLDNERGCGHRVPADVGDRFRISAIVKSQEVRAYGKGKPEPQTVVTHLKQTCDGWGFAPRNLDEHVVELAASMISQGSNKPIVKAKAKRTAKKKAA